MTDPHLDLSHPGRMILSDTVTVASIVVGNARLIVGDDPRFVDVESGDPLILVSRYRLAEVLRVGGIAYHREHDKEWRDNPWKDGISVDLDGPALDYLVHYIATHAEHDCGEHDER